MKRKIWVAILLVVTLLLSLILTACQSEGSDVGADSNGNDKGKAESSGSVPAVTANWTIEEAIENHMRFSCKGSSSLYAVDTKLYASTNSMMMAKGSFQNYVELVASGEASSTIRQIQIESYQYETMILDSNGKIWYRRKNIFPKYNITYFSCKSTSGSGTPCVLAAVTDEGKVIWDNAYSLEKPKEQEGLEGVKYVDVSKNIIAYVREDGTAGYCKAGQECHEIEGWNDIAMVFFGGKDVVLGLKKDGTLVAETCEGGEALYSPEILSWRDIVYVDWGFNFVAGLKSDGSVVYALDSGVSNSERAAVLDNWSNVMVLSTFGDIGAITADNVLLGDAQDLVYAWNLTQPWEGNEAALREHIEDEKNHRTYTEKLAEID